MQLRLSRVVTKIDAKSPLSASSSQIKKWSQRLKRSPLLPAGRVVGTGKGETFPAGERFCRARHPGPRERAGIHLLLPVCIGSCRRRIPSPPLVGQNKLIRPRTVPAHHRRVAARRAVANVRTAQGLGERAWRGRRLKGLRSGTRKNLPREQGRLREVCAPISSRVRASSGSGVRRDRASDPSG
jgi:hypothetical protein